MKKVSKFVQIFDPKMFFYDFIKITGALPVLIDLRIKKIFVGKRKHIFRGRLIISSNHMSYIDPVIISAAAWNRRVGFVATSELFKTKGCNRFFRGVGCIPIDKQNPSLETFKKVEERIDRGHAVGVFPEGQVSNDASMNVFKSGIVMMAIMSNADILPMYLVKREKRIRRQVVVVGERIKCSDYIKNDFPTMDEIQTITNVLATKEEELKEVYEKRKRK